MFVMWNGRWRRIRESFAQLLRGADQVRLEVRLRQETLTFARNSISMLQSLAAERGMCLVPVNVGFRQQFRFEHWD